MRAKQLFQGSGSTCSMGLGQRRSSPFHVRTIPLCFVAELLDALLCRNGSAAGSDEENAGAAGSEAAGEANGHTPGAAAASNGDHTRNRHKSGPTTATEKAYTPEQAESVKG